MKIAVTGGRGRLAPGLAHHLRACGHDVVLVSRVAEGRFHRLDDLLQPGGLRGFNAVLHLGWSTVPLVAEHNQGIEHVEDFPVVSALVEAAAAADSAVTLVFFSTAAVYGNTGREPATEESPCQPLGRYAAAKLGAERLFARHRNTCILRISNVIGATVPSTRSQGVIPVLVQAARDGSPVTLWGDGSATKDYLAAPDLHGAVAAALASDVRGVFNVASGGSLSVNQLVDFVTATHGRPIVIRHQPAYPWDVNMSRISAEKFRRATGWAPQISTHEFIRGLIHTAGEHPAEAAPRVTVDQ
jgi:UDP-glucose 4-epimerase